MKFNGRSGVQLRAPQDLADLAAYTSLKFYLQHPEPAPGQVAGDQFVLYMGSRQVPGGPGGRGGAGRRDGVGGLRWVAASLALPPHRLPATTWAWLCVTRKCTGCTASGARAPPLSASTRTSGSSLPLSESTGGRPGPPPRRVPGPPPPIPPSPRWRGHPATPHPLHSVLRILQFGHMSVTVENQMVQETKGDTVAPGAEGLLSLQPDDFVFYVGGYPRSFTVSLAPPPLPLALPGSGFGPSRGRARSTSGLPSGGEAP